MSSYAYESRRRAYLKKKRFRRRLRRILYIVGLLAVIMIILLVVGKLLSDRNGGEGGGITATPKPGATQGGEDTPTNTPTSTPTPTNSPTPTPTPNVVSMIAVGDNLLDWYMLEDAQQEDGSFDFSGYYTNIEKYIALGDFAVVNQETPLGGDEGYKGSGVEYDYIGSRTRWGSYHGYSTFNSPDEIGHQLVKSGFNVVTSATNHISDYGITALHNTIAFWKQYPEVTMIGINESAEAEQEITVVEKYGIKLALLNYTYGLNIRSALDEEIFSVNLLSESRVKRDVAKAKELADFVIVFPHWGTEYQMTANSYQKNYTKLFLECGVDVVVGAHPHISQPMEWLEREDGHRMVVYYSLGNFISMFKNAKCELEGMAYLEFYKDEDECYIKEGSIIPLVNHWTYDEEVFGKRKDFTVYALQDYTPELAGSHGCLNYSEGKSFGYEFINELATDLWGDNIKYIEW